MTKLIAVAIDKNGATWNGHFGMAPFFLLFNKEGKSVGTRENPYAAGSSEHKHHDDPKRIVDLLNDCDTFIAKRMGDKSKRDLVGKMNVTAFITKKENPFDSVKNYLEKIGE